MIGALCYIIWRKRVDEYIRKAARNGHRKYIAVFVVTIALHVLPYLPAIKQIECVCSHRASSDILVPKRKRIPVFCVGVGLANIQMKDKTHHSLCSMTLVRDGHREAIRKIEMANILIP